MRFLVTAPPLPLVTTRPTRGGPGRPGVLTSTIPPLRLLFPAPRTLRKSRALRSDSYSGSETLPALVPSRLEHSTTSTRAHPVSESVTPFATSHFGLVGAFHQGEGVGEKGTPQVTESPVLMSKYGPPDLVFVTWCLDRDQLAGKATPRSKRSCLQRATARKPEAGREEITRVAKRRRDARGRARGIRSHTTIWKTHCSPGVFLWTSRGHVIHTRDSRDLDWRPDNSNTRPTRTWERQPLPCRTHGARRALGGN